MKIEPDRQIVFYEFICRHCGTQFTAGNTSEDTHEHSFTEFFSKNAGCFYATCDCPKCRQVVYSVSHYHVANVAKDVSKCRMTYEINNQVEGLNSKITQTESSLTYKAYLSLGKENE